MKLFFLLSVALVATCASAVPPLTVLLTKLQERVASPAARAARVDSFKGIAASGGPTNVPASNLFNGYTTSIGIGSPPTYYNLAVDTGSSNTWCGAGTPYVQTNTSVPTGKAVNVSYGIGGFLGMEYLDQVTLAPNLVIQNQSIGDASFSTDFQGIDGILGLGPLDLTETSITSDPYQTIPTVMNNLVSQGLIANQVLGVYFAPPTQYGETNGALTFGGVDSSLYQGEITYVPVTTTQPSSRYWGINVTSCTFGNQTIIPTSTAGVVDTGSTQVILADDLFAVYMQAIPGATYDDTTGSIVIPPSSINDMCPLNFSIGGSVFSMDVTAQLVPTYESDGWAGAVPGTQYGVVTKLGSLGGEGLDFILGEKFMERFYTVFDTDGGRVGFASTNNTFAT